MVARRAFAAPLAALLALAAAGGPPAARGADARNEVVVADDLSSDERKTADVAFATTVRFATAPEGFTPPAHAAEASGVVVSADGLVATTDRFLRRVEAAPAGVALWARAGDGPWERTRPVARAWFARLGVVRMGIAATPRAFAPFATAPRRPRPRVVVAVAGSGPRVDVRATPVASLVWADPGAGRVEVRRTSADREPGKGAAVIGLRVGEAAAGRGAEGTPLFLADGRCAGLVLGVDAERPGPEAVRAVPSDVVGPWVERIAADGGFDPLDLGVAFLPAPAEAGAAVVLPRDLEALRTTTAEKGGAVAADLVRKSPALGILWAGDLVVEIGGRTFVGEIPECHALAAAAFQEGVPVEVVTWRGGKRATVTITPVRARTLYRNVAGEMDLRATRLDR
ncbi:MAG: serine protease [Planctomycetia bacterium]|nr:serine protease [Planctomycetia bacterium]